MNFVKITSLGFLIFFFSQTASPVQIEKLGIENGLSNNNVVSIAQDNDGFLWFCTKDGLNRFDARTFRTFRKSESDPNSVCSNFLNHVYADKFDDVVWIASEKSGVDAYNYRTHTFTHYARDHENSGKGLSGDGVTFIDGDENGNLWFATYEAGIDFLDRKTQRFSNFNQSNTPGLGSNYNWCIWIDSTEKLYAGHVNKGFSIIDLKSKTAVNFQHVPGDPNSLPDNTVTSIFKDSRENIWIGTRNGLTLFDAETHRMKNFKARQENPFSLSHNFIQSIVEAAGHKLWIGTEGGGVNILDLNLLVFDSEPENTRFEHILASETPEGLSNLSVQTIFQDSFGNIWIGGLGSGINFIPSRESMFKKIVYLPYIGNTNSLNDKSVPGLCTGSNDNIWVANSLGGIAVYADGKKIRQVNDVGQLPAQQMFLSMYKSGDNAIWIGTDRGKIYRYDNEKETFTTIEGFEFLDNFPIYLLFGDSQKNLWIATDIGLCRYNMDSGERSVFTTENSGLPDNIIRAVAEDGNGNIWVGTLIGGLCVFDKDFNLVENYGQKYDFYAVNHLFRDSKNRMWIGSQNDLFLIKNQFPDSVTRIGKTAGLVETDIRAITEGKSADEIWLSTTRGISHIDLNTMHVSNFENNDGIAYGDYLNGSVTKTAAGNIFFGSQNGITWFNHALEQSTTPDPQTVFTGFSVTTARNFQSEFTDIPFGDEVELKYNQNSFKISFNVLDYALAEKVEFIYQMKGLNDDWFLVEENEVAFRNLKPGTYVFNLKSTLQYKDWPGQFDSLIIRIKPPLWLSWWMQFVYICLFVLLIFYFLRFYKNKLQVENDLLLEKKSRQREHELNEEKLRFYTNITHELRSPMTLILGPLEDLISEDSLKPEHAKKLHLIHRIANRLLQSINQILEFRKSENKSRKLSVVNDDLVKHIYDIGLKYKDLNYNKNISFEIDVPARPVDMFFDPDVLTIIVENLLSNAFKYTREGNIKLELALRQEDNIDYAEISVSDTGYGISEKDLPHIFDRYYQAKNAAHPLNGTGIGLALVKNMVELHEASISVTSRLNEGSEFKVRLLTKNSYPDAIHYNPALTRMEENEENAKHTILVVDDNAEIVEYIKEALNGTYAVLSAENGEAGLKLAMEEIPDIIISDIMMPIMDGIEMCKELKKDIKTSHIPLVLLTAKNSAADQKAGYDAGADSYLTKPFSSNLLKSRLKNILDSRKKYSLATTSKFKHKQEVLHESLGDLDKEFLKKLTAVIEENLEDEELNISYVSAQLNMSHSTLYRKIKALTNLTANEFIRKVRISYAEKLLITGQYNISEIMYRIGINSSSYFRQCFKEEFGMNPSEYLNKLKEN